MFAGKVENFELLHPFIDGWTAEVPRKISGP
jgi:hypothetical protein